MKTNDKQLAELKSEMDKAVSAFNAYNKQYKEEHNIKGRNIIREIITLYKEGLSNPEIIAKGYNKHTVSEQVRLFKKGKRVSRTIVAQYLPEKEKKEKKGSK